MTFILSTIIKILKAYPSQCNSTCLQMCNKPIKTSRAYERNLHLNKDDNAVNFIVLICTTPYMINIRSKLI